MESDRNQIQRHQRRMTGSIGLSISQLALRMHESIRDDIADEERFQFVIAYLKRL